MGNTREFNDSHPTPTDILSDELHHDLPVEPHPPTRIVRGVLELVTEHFVAQPSTPEVQTPSLPDLSVDSEAGVAESEFRTVLSLELSSSETPLLRSTETVIEAHLGGRRADALFWGSRLQILFSVTDRSDATQAMVRNFGERLIPFLGLPPETPMTFSIAARQELRDSIDEMMSKLPLS